MTRHRNGVPGRSSGIVKAKKHESAWHVFEDLWVRIKERESFKFTQNSASDRTLRCDLEGALQEGGIRGKKVSLEAPAIVLFIVSEMMSQN